jgi:cell wall-associated NlpC family hydrolase
MSRVTRATAIGSAVLAVLVVGVIAVIVIGRRSDAAAQATFSGPATESTKLTTPADWVFDRAGDPARTIVHDKQGHQLAVFTDGARTVDINGPARTFREPRFTKASVTADVWVRLAPRQWHAGAQRDTWFQAWFARELTDKSPDVLAVTFQYVYGAPDLYKGDVRYAGDAQFGPFSSTDPDGRAENNDFYDYLGITYTFSDGKTVKPHKSRYGDVDCSGFIRLVYGYRLGYPLRDTSTPGAGLPRRAFAMSRYGPGVEVIKNQHGVTMDYSKLQPGDLVFFNVDPSDGPQADHSGIFLGVDDFGHYRFISSRTLANGPTMGDSKYDAIVDGDGHFALALVNARRL